jgi:hypothetical protein
VCNSATSVNVKGTSSAIANTLGEVMLKLSTEIHEADLSLRLSEMELTSPVMDNSVKTFFEDKKAKIDYERREIIMGDVRIKFDDNNLANEQGVETFATLKPRRETMSDYRQYQVRWKLG